MNVDVSILYPVFVEFNDGKNESCGKYDIYNGCINICLNEYNGI